MIADKDLSAFVQGKLTTKYTESEINEACIKFIKAKSFKTPDIAASYGCYLVCQIYDWGFYPTQLIGYMAAFKGKTKFEEINKREITEKLTDTLLKLVLEDMTARVNGLYFKLIGLQRFQNLKSKKLLDQLIQISLASVGQYVITDKMVYIILIKLSLKISDDIKEFKVIIAEKSIGMIFMMFSKLSNDGFLEQPEIIKNYLYYLKLLVTFGKEIIDITSSGRTFYDENKKLVFEEKNDHFSCLVRMLVFNLFIHVKKSNSFGFVINHPLFESLIKTSPFRIRVSEQFDLDYSDYNNCTHAFFSNKDFECDQYAKNFDSEAEVVDKIKGNSLKLLTVFVRNMPELFHNQQNLRYFLPSNLNNVDLEQLLKSKHLVPKNIYNQQLISLLEFRSKANIMLKGMLDILTPFVDQPQYVQSQANKSGYHMELAANKKKCFQKLCEDGESNINLVIAMLSEGKFDIKSGIIELLCVFQDTMTWLANSNKTSDVQGNQSPADSSKGFMLDKVKIDSQSLLTLFLAELYLTKNSYVSMMLEGMSQTPSKVVMASVTPAISSNLVNFFILPVLASAFHLNYEFLAEFEKFFIIAFDSGFSEYFLSKIQFIKEILITNLTNIARQKKPTQSLIPKTRFYLTVIDRILAKNYQEMLDIIPFLCKFYVNNILKVEGYGSLYHFAPLLFTKLLNIQKQVIQPIRLSKVARSLSCTDLRLPVNEHIRPPASKSDYDSQVRSKSITCTYLDLDDLIKWMYSQIFGFSASHDFTDTYENAFTAGFTSISSRLIYYINLELQMEQHLDIEDCLMTILNKMKSKKNKLVLVDYILSNQHMLMFNVRKKMWQFLFTLFNDKALGVEIVFTNYNIIFGLKNFSQLVNERYIVKIFYQTVSSMKSKNRKLINNCLKIFGYLLSCYSISIVEWIVDMELPNVFYDEMEGANKKDTIQSIDFLIYVFKKFLFHKYSKFNIITMSSLARIEKRHENKEEHVSKQLIQMVDSLASTVYHKLINAESFKMKNLALQFVLKKRSLINLSEEEILGLTHFVLSLMGPQKLGQLIEKIQKDPEEKVEMPEEVDKDAKIIMERDSLLYLLQIQEQISHLSKDIVKWQFYQLISEEITCFMTKISSSLKMQEIDRARAEALVGSDCAFARNHPKYICLNIFPSNLLKGLLKIAAGIADDFSEGAFKKLPSETAENLAVFLTITDSKDENLLFNGKFSQ